MADADERNVAESEPGSRTGRKRAAVYSRYSTLAQGEQSDERQQYLAATLADRMSVQIVEVYADRGKSGTTLHERTELVRLRSDAKAKKFDIVFVESIDRLARDLVDLHDIYRELVALKIELYECTGGIVSDIGLLFGGLLSEESRAAFLARTKSGRISKFNKGLIVPHRPRYGFRPDSDPRASPGVVLHEHRAEVVRGVFSKYATGVPMAEIARDLTAANEPTPGDCSAIDTGKRPLDGPYRPWTPDIVSSMLRSPLYKGLLLDLTTRTVRDHETRQVSFVQRPPDQWLRRRLPDDLRIVDEGTWDTTCEMLHRKEVRGERAFRSHENLLNGLVTCGVCGRHLRSYTQNRQRRWRCGDACTPVCEGIRRPKVESVEREVILALRDFLADSRFPDVYRNAYMAEYRAFRMRMGPPIVHHPTQALHARRYELVDRIALLSNTPDSAGFDRRRLNELKAKMQAQVSRLERSLRKSVGVRRNVTVVSQALPETLEARLDDLLGQLPFRSQDREGRRLVASLRDLIQDVTLMPSRSGDPPNAEITLHLGVLVGRRSALNGTSVRLVRRDGVSSPIADLDFWGYKRAEHRDA